MVAPTARDSMSFGSILRANYTETLGRAGPDHKIGNRIFSTETSCANPSSCSSAKAVRRPFFRGSRLAPISGDERLIPLLRLLCLLRLFAANLPGSAFRVFRVFRGHSSVVRDQRRLASISGSKCRLLFVPSAPLCGQSCKPFSPQITRIARKVP